MNSTELKIAREHLGFVGDLEDAATDDEIARAVEGTLLESRIRCHIALLELKAALRESCPAWMLRAPRWLLRNTWALVALWVIAFGYIGASIYLTYSQH